MEPVPAALEALRARYAALLEEVSGAEAQTDRNGLLSHIFSGHSYHPGLDGVMQTYGPALDAALGELLAALETLPPEEAVEPAQEALELLLFYPRQGRGPAALAPGPGPGRAGPALPPEDPAGADAAQPEKALEGPEPELTYS